MGLNIEANGEKCAARRYLVVANDTVVLAMSRNYSVAYTAYSRLRGRYKRVSLAAVAYDFDLDPHESEP